MKRKHYIIRCYLSKEEFDKIRKESKENGFTSTSCYLRFLAQNSMFRMQGKINAIYERIISIGLN